MSLNLGSAYASIDVRLDRLEKNLSEAERKFASTGKKIKDQSERLKRNLTQSFGELGRTLTIGLTAPLAALGTAAVKAAVDMDSLKRGLRAVAGSSAEAEKQMVRLKEVAKLPGLGFKEAIQGSINLQAAGLNAKLAERALMGFGNALATVGKGKADLDGVNLALTQIAAKGKVSAEEINQLQERVPQIRQIMLQAFGTADTEVLQKAKIGSVQFIEAITTALEKIPKVTGGAQNAFENFSDQANRSLAKIGDSLLKVVVPALNKLTEWIEKAADGFDKMSDLTKATFGGLAVGGAIIGPALLGLSALANAIKNINDLIKGGAIGRLLGFGGTSVLPYLPAAAGAAALYGISNLGEEGGMSSEVRAQAEEERRMNRPSENKRRQAFLLDEIAQFNRNRGQDWWKSMSASDKARSLAEQKARLDEMKQLQNEFRPASIGGLRALEGEEFGGGLGTINATARAAAMEDAKRKAKEAASAAKEFAKDQIEDRKQFEVDMATLDNKFKGERVTAEQEYQEKLRTLGQKDANKLYTARLKDIQKREDQEKKDLADAAARKLKLQKDAIEKEAKELQEAYKKSRERIEHQDKVNLQEIVDDSRAAFDEILLNKSQIERRAKNLADYYLSIFNRGMDLFRSQIGKVDFGGLNSEAATKGVGPNEDPWNELLPPGADTERGGMPKGPSVPEQQAAMQARLERVKKSLERTLGGSIAVEIGFTFADKFAEGIEKAMGGGTFGKTIGRAFSRWMNREMNNLLDSAFMSLAKSGGGLLDDLFGGLFGGGKKKSGGGAGGIGGLIGGVAGLLGFADGGYVPGPIGQARPAVVHGGEFVLSRAMLQGGGAGVTVNMGGVTVAGDYDVDRMMDRVYAHARNRLAVNPGTF